MPKQVKPVIMFLILDYVYMKMKKDIERKILVIDEAWSLLARAEEEGYIFEIVKTCRKFNLGLLLITQDVGDLLSSKAGNALLSNSSYTILLRQKPAIIDKVTETFHLSRNERDILLTAGKGEVLFIAENEHSEIKVKASDEEHKLITTNPDELLANKKEETKNTTLRKVSIKVDSRKGFFRKKNLSKEDIKFLLEKGYVESRNVYINEKGADDFLFQMNKNMKESNGHAFLVRALGNYLKQFTDKIKLYQTLKPDIIFWCNGKDYAIEVETAEFLATKKKVFLKKVKKLKNDYGIRWFFVVTNAEHVYNYKKYGRTYTRKNVHRKIQSLFKKIDPKNKPKKLQK